MPRVADLQAGAPGETSVSLQRNGETEDLTFTVREPIADEALLTYMVNGVAGQTYTIAINGNDVVVDEQGRVDTGERHARQERISPGILRDGSNTVMFRLTSEVEGELVIHDVVLFWHRNV